MERRAVCTLALGDAPYFALTHPLLERYAARIGAEFVRIEGPYEGRRSNLRKLEIGALLDRYDRIAYFDGDVAARPDAPDLFDLVPASRIGACMEGAPWFPGRGELLREACEHYGVAAPSPLPDAWVNTGVLVVSREHRRLFAPAPPDVRAFGGGYMDMPLFNARLVGSGLEVEPLDMAFNYMGSLARMWSRPYNAYDAWFFHATGGLGRDRMWYLRTVVEAWGGGLPLRRRPLLAARFALRAAGIRVRRWRPFRRSRRQLRTALSGGRDGGSSPSSSKS
jgi:hypothetical protein